jgi:hypothetical protein
VVLLVRLSVVLVRGTTYLIDSYLNLNLKLNLNLNLPEPNLKRSLKSRSSLNPNLKRSKIVLHPVEQVVLTWLHGLLVSRRHALLVNVQVALLKVLPHKRKIHLNPGLNNDS